MKTSGKEILYISMMIAAMLATYLLIVRPDNQRRNQLLSEIDAKQKLLASLNDATQPLEPLEARVETLSHSMDHYRSHLPDAATVDATIDQIVTLAKAHAMNTQIKKDLPSAAQGNMRVVPVHFLLDGSFNSLYAFMLELERNPVPVRCLKLSLQSTDDNAGELHATLTALVPFLQEQP